MYGVHISFDDGCEPVTNFKLSRKQYNEKMRGLQIKYDLEIEHVDEFTNGDRLIFVNAYARTTERLLKNIEKAKSRSRYYSKKDRV